MRVLFIASMYPALFDPSSGSFNRQRASMFRAECGLDVAILRPHLLVPPEAVVARLDLAALTHWVATLRKVPARYFLDGTEVVSAGWLQPPKRWFWHLWGDALYTQLRPRVRSLVGAHRPDLILASRLVPEGVAAARLARDYGVPSVIVAEGSEILVDMRRGRFSARLAGRLGAEPSAIVYVSRALREAARASGVRHKLEAIIPNAVDFRRFRLAPPRAPRLQHRIAAIGPLFAVKGYDILIRSLPELRGLMGTEVELQLVGAGPERVPLEMLSRQLGVSKSVRFSGAVDHRAIPAHIAHADLVCMPSRSEGFGVVAAEALASGRPVVAFDVGGLNEVVRDGVDGLLVRQREPRSLAGALADALSRTWDGERLRAHAEERFSVRAVGAQWTQLFRRLQ